MLVAEAHRGGVAAVLAADADRSSASSADLPALDRDPHQLADTFLVERRERVVREDAVLEVAGEELALGVVAREPERGLGQVVRAEREEVGVKRDLVRADAGPRELDHRSDEIGEVAALRLRGSDRELAQPAQLLRRTRRAGA